MATADKKTKAAVEELFKVGAHYGYSKSRRHPSVKPFMFGTKNTVEIFDLEKTSEKLEEAESFIAELGKEKKKILFISGKSELGKIIVDGANAIEALYVAGRWIGGTLTNLDEIRKRINKLADLKEKKEKGELDKTHTKRERMLIDKDIEDLESKFGGLANMDKLPAALFVIDPRQEHIAVKEASNLDIPVVALASSDCDISEIAYPIPANDSSFASVSFFVNRIVEAYKRAK